jgi:hypothetical protein
MHDIQLWEARTPKGTAIACETAPQTGNEALMSQHGGTVTTCVLDNTSSLPSTQLTWHSKLHWCIVAVRIHGCTCCNCFQHLQEKQALIVDEQAVVFAQLDMLLNDAASIRPVGSTWDRHTQQLSHPCGSSFKDSAIPGRCKPAAPGSFWNNLVNSPTVTGLCAQASLKEGPPLPPDAVRLVPACPAC